MGYIHRCRTWEEATSYLGGTPPVLSKLGLIIKERAGKRKVRLVIDSKQSQVSKASRKFQRMELPKIIHAVWDMLELCQLEHSNPSHELEHMVADFKDTFFLLPNCRAERQFFAVKFLGDYFIFLKTAQGSTAAPLTWARVAALITRLTMSVLGPDTCRMNTYVDDPLISCFGVKEHRNKSFTLTLLVWGALRLPLSLQKAKINAEITWITGLFKRYPGGITVSIKEELLTDIGQMVTDMLKVNLVKMKTLMSLDGKLVHVASSVQTVRPFLTDLRGALYAKETNAPTGMVWTRQFRHVLFWLKALMTGEYGALERDYVTAVYHGLTDEIEINLDASPWGIGGYIIIRNTITRWFSSPISTQEAEILYMKIGDAAGQQTAEALAALVALRAWHKLWNQQPALLRVRSDSVSALVLALNLKSTGKGSILAAGEMALDVAKPQWWNTFLVWPTRSAMPSADAFNQDDLLRFLHF